MIWIVSLGAALFWFLGIVVIFKDIRPLVPIIVSLIVAGASIAGGYLVGTNFSYVSLVIAGGVAMLARAVIWFREQ